MPRKKSPFLRGLGWKKDRPNPLDLPYKVRQRETPLPTEYIRPPAWCWPMMDQNKLGACTAFGGVRIVQNNLLKRNLPTEPLSCLELYWNTRALEHTTDDDAGAEIRDVIDALHTQGVGPEDMWPYDETKFMVKPPANVERAGMKNLALTRERIDNTQITQIKDALANAQNAVIFGALVWEDIQQLPTSGILPMPKKNKEAIGGHCMVLEGYSDGRRAFWTANSWGTDYGLAGYFWIPYAYITNPAIASDFWHVELVGPKPTVRRQ